MWLIAFFFGVVNYLHDVSPHAKLIVNDHAYHMCYFLINPIYPNWTIFQKTIFEP
jgi:hypothetical protein